LLTSTRGHCDAGSPPLARDTVKGSLGDRRVLREGGRVRPGIPSRRRPSSPPAAVGVIGDYELNRMPPPEELTSTADLGGQLTHDDPPG
jgi:hypothetical protein